MGVSISGLTAATTIAEADVFEIEQSGVSKKITKTQLRALMFSDPAFVTPAAVPQNGDLVSHNGTDFIVGAIPRWRVVPAAAYTVGAVANNYQITFSGAIPASGVNRKAGDYFAVGSPVRVVIGSTTFYGICTAVADALLTITGPPLTLATAIVSVSVGTPDMVQQIPVYVGKAGYAAAVADLTAGQFRWRGRTGYLVAFSGSHETTGQPKINIKCNGNLVSTNDASNGIQLSATPGTWVDNPVATISQTNYAIADSQNVVVRVTALVATQNYLSLALVFVVP